MMQRNYKNKGFTLIELLVTISISVMLMTSMIVNFRATTKNVVLNTLSNSVVTEIRGTQKYSISNIGDSIGNFPSYGIFFDSTKPTSFLTFIDANQNKLYDSGELVQNFSIKNFNTIKKICVNMKSSGSTPATCTAITGTGTSINANPSVAITFIRPYPEPTFRPIGGGGNPYVDIDIILASDNGFQKTIVIWLTGQISIE